MYLDYINEAFKSLDSLTEDMFNATSDGINKMSQFLTDDDDVETVRVIDKEASTEDDIKDSYIGKVIINCNVCHSHIYEDKENIVLADEGFANLEEVCPYCGQQEGYTIVGEIKEFGKDDTEDTPEIPAEEEIVDSDSVEEDETIVTEAFGATRKFKPHTLRLLKYIGSDLVNGADAAPLEEDFKEVSITTEDQHLEMTSDENGKVTVTTEPVASNPEGEGIAPLSAETESDILANNGVEDIMTAEDEIPSVTAEENSDDATVDEDSEDVAVDELDETSFDELGESYLKEVYDNVDRFRTVDVSADNHGMIVEGIITFTSGTKRRTRFMFEATDINKKGQVRFKGTNSHLTESADAYSLVGRITNKKFIAESLKYNYSSEGSPVRGVIRRK